MSVSKKSSPEISTYIDKLSGRIINYRFAWIYSSDVARPLSYKTKTTYIFFPDQERSGKTKAAFLKNHQIVNPRSLA